MAPGPGKALQYRATEWAKEILVKKSLVKKDLTSPELFGTSFLTDRVLDFFPLNLSETG
jgi:hypothetical protein